MGTHHDIPAGPEAQERVIETIRRLGLVGESDVPQVAGLVRRMAELGGGVTETDIVAIVQAYGRAVDRIAGAGAEVGVRQLGELPPEMLERALAEWLGAVRPLARASFALLHDRRLEAILRRRLAVASSESPETGVDVAAIAVALVDLRGSTAFMLDAGPEVIESLVDELYVAGGEVASRHGVLAGKFLGDGVMFLSHDRAQLVGAAQDAVALLGERTPLHAAAGLAYGPVVRRAGDWFGTPVNLAARLVELAGPDEVLVDSDAIPRGLEVGAWRTTTPRGLPEPRRVAVL